MQLVIQIPDDQIEPVKHKLPPPGTGILEAVALDALLAFLHRLSDPNTQWPSAIKGLTRA